MGGTLNHNEMAPDSHLISINRIGHSNQNSTSKLPEPFYDSPTKRDLRPEKDMMYDTQKNAFNRRRRTTGPPAGGRLSPLPKMTPVKKQNYLKKGEGNGGSPTNYVLRQNVQENGHITLEPIGKREGSKSVVRTRNRQGGFNYKTGSLASLRDKNPESLSPRQRSEIEKQNRIQEKIAEFRLIKFAREQEKIKKQLDDANAER